MTYSSTKPISVPPAAILRVAATGAAPLSRIAHMVGLAIAAIAQGHARRQNLRALSQLDDRLLLDIGFCRFEIEQLCNGRR